VEVIPETFFIGDLHLGHKSILTFEPEARPFLTLDLMHDAIIARWNSVVRKGDKVIVNGDAVFGEKYLPLFDRRNGLKYLVGGNHDQLATATYLKYFHKVLGCMEFDKCIVTHIPVHESQFSRYRANIHGHLHSKKIIGGGRHTYDNETGLMEWVEMPDDRYINVSAEQNNLTPISWAEIKEKYSL
jgi:calcineurin-like phosphoesterase family protein